MIVTLDYPSSAAVAEAIRLRMRAAPGVPFLIVESSSDRSLLSRVLAPEVVVMSASNREKVLGARAYLSDSQRDRSIFMVDCDGLAIPRWEDRGHLVVTDYRDIDADAAIALGGLRRVLGEHLSQVFDTGVALGDVVASIHSFSVDMTTLSGIVTDAAREVGIPSRVTVENAAGRPRRRRIRADDLPQFDGWAGALTLPGDEGTVLEAIASVLGWVESDVALVRGAVLRGAQKRCRAHSAMACMACRPRRFVNGHDLVSVVRRVLSANHGIQLEQRSLEREIRLAVDHSALAPWTVVRRFAEGDENVSERYLSERLRPARAAGIEHDAEQEALVSLAPSVASGK